MERQNLQIEGRQCRIYASANPLAVLVQATDEHDATGMDEEVEAIATQSGKPFVMAAFETRQWDVELMPWPDRAVSKNPDVGEHAADTLAYITERLLPGLRQRYGALPCIIGGYSLSGLFALWAAYRTDTFAAVAASSPSVWVKGWLDFADANAPQAKHVYLSLGDKEEMGRNRTFAQVGNNIRQYSQRLSQQLGTDNTILEWNPGNHFQDSAGRTAKGFAWCLSKL